MTVTNPPMEHVDQDVINEDLPARVSYTKSFLRFTQEDGDAIASSKDLIAPALPAILDDIYTRLLSYDVTAKAFAPRQPGQEASSDNSNGDGTVDVQSLTLNHPNILYRKDFLKTYLVKMVSNKDWSDESKFWDYLNRVGVMHTGQPGFKHRQNRAGLRVEVMHMSLLLGYVEDIILQAVMGAQELDTTTKTKVISAFNKVLWIQNDLFQRHYVSSVGSSSSSSSSTL